MQTKQLFIHGTYRNSSSKETFNNINPATNKSICKIQLACQADIDDAIESAKIGFQEWAKMSAASRGRILHKASELLRKRNIELAKIEVEDTGKPISEAKSVDIHSAADALEYFAGLAPSIHGYHHDLGQSFALTRKEPLGICAGIGAWNYPLQIAAWKSAPALAAGNAMIFKPSELTPLSAYTLAEIYMEAGMPKGVFNVVQGASTTGQLLSRHKDVAKISLTGEVETGKRVMADASNTLKAVTMELGGKSPLIIFDDADLNNAVKASMMANFYTQGEICSNGTRVFVHESMINDFITLLLEKVSRLRVGDPMDENTDVGSLISKEHLEKVAGYVEQGISEGAKLLIGGKPCDRVGNFFLPTVFSQCHDDMTIVKEEIFGPVMSILSFKDEKEVIDRANNTPFGLSAGLITNNLTRAHRVINSLDAGMCWINNYNITPIEIPFGGFKQSGFGKENGLSAIDHYTRLKTIYVEMGDVDCPYFT